MASNRFTRREVAAAVPLVLAAPTLLRAQPLLDKVPALDKVWRFLVVGDWGRDGREDQRRTALAMEQVARENRTEFVISTGDNFYHWGVWSDTDYRWNTCFENVYSADLGNWYSVLGNHDYGGSVKAQISRHAISPRWNMDARWYDKVMRRDGWPPLHLLFFDTVQWLGKEGFPFMLYGDDFSEELRLNQIADMDRALAGSPGDAIRLAIGHHGIWSVGTHGGGKQLDTLDTRLKAHGVKAWVHGHDHCLFHIEQGGMHYVCSGAGSEVLASHTGAGECGAVQHCDPAAPPIERSFYRRDPGKPDHIAGGFALFEIGRDAGSFTFFNSDARSLGDGAVKLY